MKSVVREVDRDLWLLVAQGVNDRVVDTLDEIVDARVWQKVSNVVMRQVNDHVIGEFTR